MLSLGSSVQLRAEVGRPMNLDDLSNLQQIAWGYGGPFAFSPDGQQLAFAVQRPKRTAKFHTGNLSGVDRADIFVVSVSGGPAINITNGLADGASYWSPSWSPDGKRLAMLSTKGGNVYVWVWDRTTGSVKQVVDRGVDLYSTMGIDHPYVWVSPTRLLVPVLPTGEEPIWMVGGTEWTQQAANERRKAWAGEGVTASVLVSGVKPDLSKRPQAGLVAVDVDTGKMQLLTRGTVRDIVFSAEAKAVAYLRRVEGFTPTKNESLPFNDLFKMREGKFELEVRSIEGTLLTSDNAEVEHVVPASLRWSLDGKELAFLGYTKTRRDHPQLIRFFASDHSLKSVDLKEIDPLPLPYALPQIEWTARGWIIYASSRSLNDADRVRARRDWWLVGEGPLQPVTGSMTAAPAKLWCESGRDSYVGLANGDVWRIKPEGSPENLTAKFQKRISRIVWPQQTGSPSTTTSRPVYSHVVVSADEGDQQRAFIISLASGEMTAAAEPKSAATVVAFSPASGAMVHHLSDRTGMRVWIAARGNSDAALVYEANTFLQDIDAGTDQKITYKSLDGQDLSGWVLLPPGYQRDRKYPLLVRIYPGWMAGPLPNVITDITFPVSLNLQIAAARGYVVLLPSIPLNPLGEVDDPLLKLTSGVLPAVDKVIEMGIADPERIFAIGHSNGGYAMYGLVTQTNCFKAAVAMAGFSDLISGYGQFSNWRFSDYAHEMTIATAPPGMETMFRMGSPPWKDLGRYLRNSPIFYVERVQTPLLIMQGDMDGVPLEQAEEFFMALYRQGKRAEFVRYWGEGHVIDSPPNVRDMWDRIFAWFDEFSPKTTNPSATSKK